MTCYRKQRTSRLHAADVVRQEKKSHQAEVHPTAERERQTGKTLKNNNTLHFLTNAQVKEGSGEHDKTV